MSLSLCCSVIVIVIVIGEKHLNYQKKLLDLNDTE